MRSTVLLFLLIVYTAGVCGNQEQGIIFRMLLRTASASTSSRASSTGGGRASTRASAISTGGTARAVSEATSEAFAEVEDSVERFFIKSFAKVGRREIGQSDIDFCATALSVIEKDLTSVGSITARAYSDALADVQVTGSGEACADSKSSASTQASGFSEIIADAIAKASVRYTKSKAEAAVDVRINAFASVFAEAFAKACVRDTGYAVAVQSSFANAVIKPLAAVTIEVIAGVDCTKTGLEGFSSASATTAAKVEEEVEARSEGETTSSGQALSEAGGDALASGGELPRCSGVYYYCCTTRFRGKSTCDCSLRSRFRSRSQCNAVYVPTGGAVTVPYWSDKAKGINCSCSRFKQSVVVT